MRTCSRPLKTACSRCWAEPPILIIFAACLLAYQSLAVTRYVDANSATPLPPYTSWATAGTNIQNVIDSSLTGDDVLVTNGVYDTGGKYFSGSNRIAITTAIT